MTAGNAELIRQLVNDGYLRSQPVIEAFRAIDRRDFLPEEVRSQAYENIALPIGYKQTISQPLVVAFMLELLDIKPGERVLEIGTGSGWKTALISHILGDSGALVSIERIPELVEFAGQNLKHYVVPDGAVRMLISGDGSKGYSTQAPFDKIIAAASAENVPEAWKEQLKIGGRIVVPVKDSIVVLDKTSKNTFTAREYLGYNFVPLISH